MKLTIGQIFILKSKTQERFGIILECHADGDISGVPIFSANSLSRKRKVGRIKIGFPVLSNKIVPLNNESICFDWIVAPSRPVIVKHEYIDRIVGMIDIDLLPALEEFCSKGMLDSYDYEGHERMLHEYGEKYSLSKLLKNLS